MHEDKDVSEPVGVADDGYLDVEGGQDEEATAGILDEINQALGSEWELVRLLVGGYQSGAHELVGPDGERAVLKWAPSRRWARQVLRAAPLVALARANGWPTPAWLAVGVTGEGFPYHIQEFVPGEPIGRTDNDMLDLVLPLIERQSDLRPNSTQDFSAHVGAVVFDDAHGYRSRLSNYSSAAADLMRTIVEACSSARGVVIPANDLVHGQMHSGNILVEGKRVTGFIDVEAMGKGTRAVDLASLVLHAALWDGEPDALARLIDHSRHLVGREVFTLSLGAAILPLLSFGIDRWEDGDVDSAAGRLVELINAVR
jgi:aminoglycoside phosphotransferase (APT) family kinase protein